MHDHPSPSGERSESETVPKTSVKNGTTPLPEVEEFCQALDHIKNVRHVTIRKPSSVYLTQPGVMLAMKHLAQGFERWSDLVRVLLNFRHCRMVFLTSSDTMLVFC